MCSLILLIIKHVFSHLLVVKHVFSLFTGSQACVLSFYWQSSMCSVILLVVKYVLFHFTGSQESESESESEILFNIICVITISIK